MFSAGQCIFLFIITELLIWGLLLDILNTIRHCVTMRSYRKMIEKTTNGKSDKFFDPAIIFDSINEKKEEEK